MLGIECWTTNLIRHCLFSILVLSFIRTNERTSCSLSLSISLNRDMLLRYLVPLFVNFSASTIFLSSISFACHFLSLSQDLSLSLSLFVCCAVFTLFLDAFFVIFPMIAAASSTENSMYVFRWMLSSYYYHYYYYYEHHHHGFWKLFCSMPLPLFLSMWLLLLSPNMYRFVFSLSVAKQEKKKKYKLFLFFLLLLFIGFVLLSRVLALDQAIKFYENNFVTLQFTCKV